MDRRIRAAIAFMKANLHRKVTPFEIAQSVCLSASHLRSLFKYETGMSLMHALKQMRLERAGELLQTTFLSVKQIATAVGVGSINHFITDFKKMHGVTPARYAMRHRKTTREA